MNLFIKKEDKANSITIFYFYKQINQLMVDLNLNVSIVILNVNGLKIPFKGKICQNWFKNMTQPNAVHKKSTIGIIIQVD